MNKTSRLAVLFLAGLVAVFILSCASSGRLKQESMDWDKVRAQNTVAGYQRFLAENPKSKFAPQARQYLISRKVEGWVQKVDEAARTVTIKTSMGQIEAIAFESDVKVNRRGSPMSLKDLKAGESIQIQYFSLPGKAISRTISVGYSVAHCSCGSSCACPLSRGCRVIRY